MKRLTAPSQIIQTLQFNATQACIVDGAFIGMLHVCPISILSCSAFMVQSPGKGQHSSMNSCMCPNESIESVVWCSGGSSHSTIIWQCRFQIFCCMLSSMVQSSRVCLARSAFHGETVAHSYLWPTSRAESTIIMMSQDIDLYHAYTCNAYDSWSSHVA